MNTVITEKSYIRPGLRTLTPYLIVSGAARLIEFLKSAFRAEEMLRVPRPDGSIMHAEVQIGDSRIELADGSHQYPPVPAAIHLYVPDVDAVYKRAMEAGATSLHEPVDQEYGDREFGIRDPGGNNWYVATHQRAPGRHVPAQLHDVTPFLHPRGAEQFLNFVTQAFLAEDAQVYRKPDGTIIHAMIRIGDSMLEFSEAHGEWGPMPCALHVYVPDADAVYRQALAAGATSIVEPNNADYGDRFAGVRDPFGHQWYIASYLGPVSS
jgi:uncharacterized glyoxalase superfamily protein PhnB